MRLRFPIGAIVSAFVCLAGIVAPLLFSGIANPDFYPMVAGIGVAGFVVFSVWGAIDYARSDLDAPVSGRRRSVLRRFIDRL
jgi:hypothetical protein